MSHSLAKLDTGRQEEFILLVLVFKFIFFSHLFLKNGFVVFLDLIILFKWFLAFSSNSFEALHLLNILFFPICFCWVARIWFFCLLPFYFCRFQPCVDFLSLSFLDLLVRQPIVGCVTSFSSNFPPDLLPCILVMVAKFFFL